MERQLPSLPELRQTIHDLIIQSHCSGLSPPEEEMLEAMEAQEASGTRSYDCSGLFNYYRGETIMEKTDRIENTYMVRYSDPGDEGQYE